LNSALSDIPKDQRGSTYITFVELHLDAIERLKESTSNDYSTSTSESEKLIYGRKLSRVKSLLDSLYYEVFVYQNDVGRRDIPSGLLYLVDYLITDILKASADPVIHLDGLYMYSTQRLISRWKVLSQELGVIWSESVEPIIFNLPGLDFGNALLSPILAHEVGHSVIQQSDLVAEVNSRLDLTVVESLKVALLQSNPNADVDDAVAQVSRWVEELLCDAIATELTGPSLLFAAAVFLPASSAGFSTESHPDPSQRISLTLSQLDSLGWSPKLRRACPNILRYLEEIANRSVSTLNPREMFMRDMIGLAASSIEDVAREYVSLRMDWTSYGTIETMLAEMLRENIPPSEIDGVAVTPWQVIAAIWFQAIDSHGDDSAGLVAGVEDRGLNRLGLKSVELIKVLELWKVPHAFSA
jgi:hypothetical protein